MTIHQCTRCELRFALDAELKEHLDRDHHVPAEALERFSYPTRHEDSPLYRTLSEEPGQARRVLVVANQTLEGQTLRDELTRMAGDGTIAVTLLVPATPSQHVVAGWGGTITANGERVTGHSDLDVPADDAGVAQARYRLRQAVEALANAGVAVRGEVGDPNPVVAVERLLERERFDEIVLSTLPTGLSRWLGADLPARLRRLTGVPVKVLQVTAS